MRPDQTEWARYMGQFAGHLNPELNYASNIDDSNHIYGNFWHGPIQSMDEELMTQYMPGPSTMEGQRLDQTEWARYMGQFAGHLNPEPNHAFNIDISNHIHAHVPTATEAPITAGGDQSGENSPNEDIFASEVNPKHLSSTFRVGYGASSPVQTPRLQDLKAVIDTPKWGWYPMTAVYSRQIEEPWLAEDCEKRRIFGLFKKVDRELFRAAIPAWNEVNLDVPDETHFATDLRPSGDWSDLIDPDRLPKMKWHKSAISYFSSGMHISPTAWTQLLDAIKFFDVDPIFSQKDAWYSANMFRYLEKSEQSTIHHSKINLRDKLPNDKRLYPDDYKHLPSYDERIATMRTQAKVVYWLPCALNDLFSGDREGEKGEKQIEAARSLLIVRKELEEVLTYSSAERKRFKAEFTKAYLHAVNHPNILNEESGYTYELFDRVRSSTSKKDWERSLKKLVTGYPSAESILPRKTNFSTGHSPRER
ncbi:hypothetical protein CROQUDRAFT_676056 [Cronartium quercuum f. sp. fusiforme G11]|uniref:Uncharacterized protein n=1 Tax=Cronartium quercuum f. sp. fusiforme G11 TaxID=708437 RepID=A0A9P6NZU0_9BASI|nr:hypothetical protein CROQUDRAFT_676056 [Cronartium quercuum f. sp. fusiforme G11]